MRTRFAMPGGTWPVRRRQQMFDVALAGVIAVSGCVAGHEYHPDGWALFDGRAYLLSCLVALPIIWRRTAPMATVAAACMTYSLYLALGYQPSVNWWAPMIALVSLTARRSLRTSALGAVLTAGAVLHSGIAGHLSVLMAAAQALLISLVAVFLGRTQRLLAERNRELRRLTEQLRREQRERARRAVVDERMRIARELHDVVAHHMSVITVQAGLAGYVFATEPETARTALDNIAGAGREALADLRRLLSVLRVDIDEDDVPDPQQTWGPALSRLDELAERVRAAGVDVAVHTEGHPSPLPPGLEMCAYRIVQEALTNVVKHAGPTRAEITVSHLPNELRVTVRDDGGSADPATSPHGSGHGLIGMRERAKAYGGTLVAGARRAGGFEVRLILPTNAGHPATETA
ncbi:MULTISPECIES: sensor histidine kinase [unclassified Streptomyces]|uniref:sensor histidine kinase n=1 Tax=unclassified Streptomyces TaxID=2593676 RepID=UPI0033E264E2